MWNSFLHLFNLGASSSGRHPNKTKKTHWKDIVLNSASPRVDAPNTCKNIVLWDHQRAMLARCKYIEDNPTFGVAKILYDERFMKKDAIKQESNVAIGIMNDPPGAGKTYVILALVAMDNVHTTNVIVAPKNILSQWETALSTMYGTVDNCNLAWTKPTYESINRLYMNKDAFTKYRALLLDETLLDTFALAYEGKLARVIIDEVDNLSGKMTQPISTEKIWFISASFNPDDKASAEGLPYSFEVSEISSMICCTDTQFIESAIKLTAPATEIITCDDSDIMLFEDIVPDNVITSLHAGNIRPLVKYIEYTNIHTEATCESLAKWYIAELNDRISKYEDEIRLTKARIDDSDPLLNTQLESMIDILERKRVDACQVTEVLNERFARYTPPDPTRVKLSMFESKVIPRICHDKSTKWLVFNDDLSGLIEAQERLKNHGVKAEMLDGGDATTVTKTIRSFKEQDVQVLLVNSASEGCGLNLENATHVLFMHASNPALVDQIVGRAQRYGRTTRLNIIGLFNDMELLAIENGGIGTM
jgi:hypothetical protein